MANVSNRKPVSEMADELWGCLYGDKGYISDSIGAGTCRQWSDTPTDVKENMKPKVMKL
ncbi:Mobile element protein [Candidatus Enterovibrio escicola]|uniref:Mobile element protein n=1 Tax=Candidatus Enterovibrio escicola TaxID=1927127 RepID=A0A2A5T5N2_9GAMM|nr:Mobile element protein [Candidatus Enterovibrio escacola]